MVHFEDLRKAAFDAENDLNSYQAKQGLGKRVTQVWLHFALLFIQF
jgi:hypothetical protein